MRSSILYALAFLACVAWVTTRWLWADLPPIYSLADYKPPQASQVFSADNKLLAQYYVERRFVIRIADLPPHVVHAFLAAEDADFYAHTGIDWLGILRAILKNMRPGAHLQGASTITQQTVKTFILGPERSLGRKVRELILARRLERLLDKNEILALYLNQIYFGAGAWGIEAAAQTYFNRSAAEVSLAEAAYLAAIPKNPGRYTLKVDPQAARRRQTYVLQQMRVHGWITERDYTDAHNARPVLGVGESTLNMAPHYNETLRRMLIERVGERQLLTGGLRIDVGLSAYMQAAANNAMQHTAEEVAWRLAVPQTRTHISSKYFSAWLTRMHQHIDAWPHQGIVWDVRQQLEHSILGARFVPPEAQHDRPFVRVFVPVIEVVAAHDKVLRYNKVKVDLGRRTAWVAMPKQASLQARTGDIIEVMLGPYKNGTQTPSAEVVRVVAPNFQGALVAIEPFTHWVRAMVGGLGASIGTGFNHATQAHRQPGSAFKPIIYGAALMQGDLTPASICPDSPLVITDPSTGRMWRPVNYPTRDANMRYEGNITYRRALARSKNTCSVRLLEKIGPQKARDMAFALGIHENLPDNYTLALGTGDVTPIELCDAYTTIATLGSHAPPRFIVRVTNADGVVIDAGDTLQASQAAPELSSETSDSALDEIDAGEVLDNAERERWRGAPVAPRHSGLSPAAAYVLTDMLRSVVSGGTARLASVLHRPLAGKTGTSQESRDAWFAGFATDLVACVWMGFDDNTPLGRETGGSAALPAWVRFMGMALSKEPPHDFVMPPSVVRRRVKLLGLGMDAVSSDDVDGFVDEVFVPGSEPAEHDTPITSPFLQPEN